MLSESIGWARKGRIKVDNDTAGDIFLLIRSSSSIRPPLPSEGCKEKFWDDITAKGTDGS